MSAYMSPQFKTQLPNKKLYRFPFNIQTGRPQNDYKKSLNGWSQVITQVEFSSTAATQGTNHVIHLILPTPPNSERRTSPHNGINGIRTRFLLTQRHYSMDQRTEATQVQK